MANKDLQNKMMSVIGPVQSRYHEGNPVGKRKLRWEGFVERFWAWSERVMEWWMTRAGMMREMGWEVDDEVNRDENGEADEMNIWKLIPKTRWCIPKWAICDFQGGDGWRARV